MLTVTTATVFVAAAAGIIWARSFTDAEESLTAVSPPSDATDPPPLSFTSEDGIVTVELPPDSPFTISPGSLREPTAPGAWAEVELAYSSRNTETIQINAPNLTHELGGMPPALIIAGPRCTPQAREGAREIFCVLLGQLLTVTPGQFSVEVASLWRDLPGMAPLQGGQFSFEETISYQLGSAPGEPRSVVATVILDLPQDFVPPSP